jgi:enediyne biosynthesis protein E4
MTKQFITEVKIKYNNIRISMKISSIFALLIVFSLTMLPRQSAMAQNATKGQSKGIPVEKAPLLELLDAEQAGITFKNTIQENSKYNHVIWDYVYNGAGVAVGDINNDGLPDIYFTGNQVADKLYLNQGNFKFKDITDFGFRISDFGRTTSETRNPKSKIPHTWSSGVTMADVNADGLLDIYVSKFEPSTNKNERKNQLFINNGNLTFTEKADEFGLGDIGYSIQASFFDMDNDGDLDCYVVNQPPSNNVEKMVDRVNPGPCGDYTDRLYRNDGKGHFTDITLQAGVESCAYGLGIVVADINNDGWQDIYVSNDYFVSDFCYINQKDGTFKDLNKQYFKHQSLYSMGLDVADFNNDGFADVFTADMSAADHYRNKANMASMNTARFDLITKHFNHQYMFNALQVNNGNGSFSEIAQLAGVANTDWSWSSLFIDADNDGNKDLFVTNGIKRDIRFVDGMNKIRDLLATNTIKLSDILNNAPSQKLSNYAFKNTKDFHFKNEAKNWGFDTPSFSSGMAYADLDNDGDLDLVINNVDDTPFIYKNNSKQNYLRIKLKGSAANPFGYGAKATIFYTPTGGKEIEKQVLELSPTRGFLSSSEPILHFGLGSIEMIDSVIVNWTIGKTSKIVNVKANQILVIDYKSAPSEIQNPKSKIVTPLSTKPIFNEILNKTLDFKHQESDFNDFKKEVLLPNKLSEMGPAMAVGDVNGDKLEDVFVGGGAGQASQLMIQQADGTFKSEMLIGENINAEKVKALFFDANGDGKLDLYVAHGSNEFEANSPNLQDQLYINKGGKLEFDPSALPNMPTSTGVICAADIDNDGDLDLFIGSMMQQQRYPYPAKSYLLQNNKGKFTDITDVGFRFSEIGGTSKPETRNPKSELGMVRTALFTDYDNDGDKDLMLSGEWMTVEIFDNNKGVFTKATIKGLEKTRGMAHSIVANDFDGDGDEDYIIGNLGLNNKFKKDSTKHFHIFSTDFDNNGVNDVVLSKEDGKGTLLPVRGRECSSQQMPFVAEKFKTYDQFAKSTLNDIYTPEKLNTALHYEINELGSFYIENKGKGMFQTALLPTIAQFSIISDMTVGDFDKDGKMDVLAVGNKYEAEVETARYDASIGVFLKGDGKGHFQTILSRDSGFFVNENARAISKLKVNNKNAVVIGVNNGVLKLFQY